MKGKFLRSMKVTISKLPHTFEVFGWEMDGHFILYAFYLVFMKNITFQVVLSSFYFGYFLKGNTFCKDIWIWPHVRNTSI